MKKSLIFITVCFVVVSFSCQKKTDIEKEKAAIIALIEEETASYYAGDYDRWAATQVQDETNILTYASNSEYIYTSGWDSISDQAKVFVSAEKEKLKEVKSYNEIKIYNESAWVVFENEVFNNDGASAGKFLATVFLEKHDNNWKSVYRNRIDVSTYTSSGSAEGFPEVPVDARYLNMVYQANGFILNQINYAKSRGQTVQEIANFTGDQFKTSWNKANGYEGFIRGTKWNWVSFMPEGELKVLEEDENHLKFSARNLFPSLKNNSPQFNVTYDEYLTFSGILHEKIGDYLGAKYTQEVTGDGLIVTISKK